MHPSYVLNVDKCMKDPSSSLGLDGICGCFYFFYCSKYCWATLSAKCNSATNERRELNLMFKIKAELELRSFLLFCSCKQIRATLGIKCSLTTHERPRLELGFLFVLTSTSEIYTVHVVWWCLKNPILSSSPKLVLTWTQGFSISLHFIPHTFHH